MLKKETRRVHYLTAQEQQQCAVILTFSLWVGSYQPTTSTGHGHMPPARKVTLAQHMTIFCSQEWRVSWACVGKRREEDAEWLFVIMTMMTYMELSMWGTSCFRTSTGKMRKYVSYGQWKDKHGVNSPENIDILRSYMLYLHWFLYSTVLLCFKCGFCSKTSRVGKSLHNIQ